MPRFERSQLLGIGVVVLCALCAVSLFATAQVGATESPEDELNVTVSADTDAVWVNETVDLTVTVESTGENRYDIDDITIVDENGETVATKEPFGVTVGSNGEETFRLEDIEIDEPGASELRAVVSANYRLKQTDVTVDDSVTITATDPEPVVDLTAEEAMSGSERELSLSIGNPLSESINRVSASLQAPDDAGFSVVDATGTVATIGSAETSELDFAVRGGSTGTYEFTLLLKFETQDGKYWEITRPVTAQFLEPTNPVEPVVDLTADRAPDGADRRLSLSIGNPFNESLNRVTTSVSSADNANITVVGDNEVVTTIKPSETHEIEFAAQNAPTGTHEFTLSLGFETSDGEYRETTRRLTVPFLEPEGTAQVDIAEASVSATPNGVRVNGSLFTTGNLSVKDVQIAPAAESGVGPARPEPQSYLSALGGQGTGPFSLTVSLSEKRETIPLQVTYRTGTVERTTTIEVPYSGPRNVSPVQLSSVDVSGSGTVRISGEVANTRNEPVAGVTVQIPDAEGVGPGPRGEFFAGSIEGGKFAVLEQITAEVTGPRDTIPVELSYTFQGTQYSSIVEVEYTGGQTTATGGQGSDTAGGQSGESSLPEFDAGADGGSGGDSGSLLGGLPMLVGGVLVVVSLLIATVVYRRR